MARRRRTRRWAALLAAHGVRRGDRVALMAGNRIEFLSVVLGCGWLGAVAVPINTASRACSCVTSWRTTPACCWWRMRPPAPGWRRWMATAWPCARSGCWTAMRRRRAGAARAGPGGARRAARRRRTGRPGAGRHAGHPVHLRHIRPVQGRVLSACAILVVGPDRRAQPGDPRRGRALHQPAAVPHQCVERLFPGAGDGRVHRLRRAFLGQPILRPASRPAPR